MNKSLIETVIEAVDDKFKELELIRLTRRNRAIAAYAEINNSMEPNEDRNGRLHAPCDGYEDIDGRGLYNKGEFLPIPECVRLEMEMQGIHPNEKVYGSRSRVLVAEKEADDIMKMFVYNYFLPADKGKAFERDNEMMQYVYVRGNDALINVIEQTVKNYNAAQYEERRKHKGKVPVGKFCLTGKLLMVRVIPPINEWDRTTVKMLVELENKATIYGTLPKRACNEGYKAGDEISIAGTFSASISDDTHGYVSRPRLM